MPDHRIFLRSPDMLLVNEELHATQAWKKAILNVLPDKPESSTRGVAQHASVSHQTIYRVLKKIAYTSSIFSDTIFESGRLSSLPELLPVGGTAMCAVVRFHSSCAIYR
ncbi:hypothetical protein TNCV_460081 [Trichonephila clavipes]|nr:hypothetical protein TNCV_460081 [Trichonephila clavipes]